MRKSLTIKARITGIPVRDIKLRRKIIDGNLTNQWELAFTMVGLGTLAMDEDVKLDIYDQSLPIGERCWTETTVAALKSDLLAGKFIKKKISAS